MKKRKIVGVACGTQVPKDCREKAHRLGLMTMYPSGNRYRVDGKPTLINAAYEGNYNKL